MTGQCVICGKPVVQALRLFCSPRCQQVDLHRWFGEVYTAPVIDEPAESLGDDADEKEIGPNGADR